MKEMWRIGKIENEAGGGRDKRGDSHFRLTPWARTTFRATFSSYIFAWISTSTQPVGWTRVLR